VEDFVWEKQSACLMSSIFLINIEVTSLSKNKIEKRLDMKEEKALISFVRE
jgi:hypothetical protein